MSGQCVNNNHHSYSCKSCLHLSGKDFLELTLPSSKLDEYETHTEELKLTETECEYICMMKDFLCNFYSYDYLTSLCTWGKVSIKVIKLTNYTLITQILDFQNLSFIHF